MARGRKHTAEQIVRRLRETERLKTDGATVAAICQRLEISEQTHHR